MCGSWELRGTVLPIPVAPGYKDVGLFTRKYVLTRLFERREAQGARVTGSGWQEAGWRLGKRLHSV